MRHLTLFATLALLTGALTSEQGGCQTDVDEDGYTLVQGDCDDQNPEVNPGATEVCDGIDNNCDGRVDEGFDADGDSVATCNGDCDDQNPDVHPYALEECNGIDDNCDGEIDPGFDADGDGYTSCGGDCDDGDAGVNPGASEACNGVDDDCDGVSDEGFDEDGDGYTSCGGDCDDGDAGVNPDAGEGEAFAGTTGDGIDNDCDGYVDIDCDGTSEIPLPLVKLSTPARGTFTQASSVAVAGLVLPGADRSPVTEVDIDGVPATVTACSDDGGVRFSGSASLYHGLNTVRITATDLSGGLDKAEVSVISSPTFLNVHDRPVSRALIAELNQGTWDILADFLEGYLTAADLQAELLASNPLVHDSGDADCLEKWEIYGEATAYTHDDVEIDFTISGGKIRSTARIIHPQMWATGWIYYDLDWYCGGWSDTVDLDMYLSFSEVTATADAVPTVDSNGNVVIDFTNVQVNASGGNVSVDADNWLYDWLIDMMEDEAADRLEQFIENELRSYVDNELGPLAADELNNLPMDYTVDVWGTPYGVVFDIESIEVATNTVDVGFSVGLAYAVDPRIPANPGAVDFANGYARTTDPTVAFKVGLDFFNAALHAMWEGGSLYVSGPISSDPPMYATAEPLLPPVVTPGASPYLLLLSVGDVLGTIEVPMGDDVEALTAAMSAQVQMDLDPIVDGYEIWFDVTFGPVQLSFDMLSDMAMDPELQASMEEGLSEMLTMYLDELEAYLEAQSISYLEIPVQFSSLTIGPDSSNPGMLTVTGQATYTGP